MKYLKPLFLVVVLAALVSTLFLPARLIRINKLDCHSQYGECNSLILDKIRPLMGKPLGETKDKIAKILKNERQISSFSLQFRLPDVLRVDIIVRKPSFALKSSAQNLYGLIDKEGIVLGTAQSTNLPTLLISDPLSPPGKALGKEELFGLEITQDLFYLYQVDSGQIIDGTLVFELPEGPKAIFPLEGDREVLVGSLRLILSGLNSQKQGLRIESVKEIDLRFKNPVLR